MSLNVEVSTDPFLSFEQLPHTYRFCGLSEIVDGLEKAMADTSVDPWFFQKLKHRIYQLCRDERQPLSNHQQAYEVQKTLVNTIADFVGEIQTVS